MDVLAHRLKTGMFPQVFLTTIPCGLPRACTPLAWGLSYEGNATLQNLSQLKELSIGRGAYFEEGTMVLNTSHFKEKTLCLKDYVVLYLGKS